MLYLNASEFIFIIFVDFLHTFLEFCWQRLCFVVNANTSTIVASIILGTTLLFSCSMWSSHPVKVQQWYLVTCKSTYSGPVASKCLVKVWVVCYGQHIQAKLLIKIWNFYFSPFIKSYIQSDFFLIIKISCWPYKNKIID